MSQPRVNLHELDADEFYDVYRTFKPDATRAEFERDWAEFQRVKEAHQKVMLTQ
jgi:hypothetical protein